MKKNLKSIAIAAFLIFWGMDPAFSQGDGMNTKGLAGSKYAGLRNDPPPPFTDILKWEKALGVYQANISPNYFLEVNNDAAHMPLLAAWITPGNMFSTNSRHTVSNWQMSVMGTEKGLLFNAPANPLDFNIQSSEARLRFWTDNSGIPLNRILIDDDVTIGRVAMADNIMDPSFAGGPQSRLHIAVTQATTPQPSDLRFTNVASGHGFNNGFRIGITPLADVARLAMLQPTGEMRFFTGGAPGFGGFDRVKIEDATNTGRVAMGDDIDLIIPQSRLHIAMTSTPSLPSDLRFTNFASGHAFPDGFRIGIEPTAQTARLAMLEPTGDLRFSTGGLNDRIKILSTGQMLIADNVTPLAVVPNNRLEITSAPIDPNWPLATPGGSSGLRLTHITPTTVTTPNPGLGILAVDSDGDVIYVDCCTSAGAITGAQNGLNLTGTNVELGGPLLHHTNVNLSNFNLYLDDPGGTGKVSIGHALPAARLDVLGTGNTSGTSNTVLRNSSFASLMDVKDNGSTNHNIRDGVFEIRHTYSLGSPLIGVNNNINMLSATGATGYLAKINGNVTAAIGFDADLTSSTASIYKRGFSYVDATSNSLKHGAFIDITTGPGGINYGVIARTIGTDAVHAIHGDAPTGAGQWAAWFNGEGFISASFWNYSDRKFKENVEPIKDVMSKLEKLNGYNYTFKTEEYKDINFSKGKQVGFIAQELKEVFPELVKEENGNLAVNYMHFAPILVQALKEQQAQINELKTMLQNASSNFNGNDRMASVNLSDAQSIILEQNVPNPFAEQTTINYTLTSDTKKAQILFYNMDGKLINTAELKAVAGKGQLNVFASDLSSGLFSYTLVVDGKIMDTKKMIKQ